MGWPDSTGVRLGRVNHPVTFIVCMRRKIEGCEIPEETSSRLRRQRRRRRGVGFQCKGPSALLCPHPPHRPRTAGSRGRKAGRRPSAGHPNAVKSRANSAFEPARAGPYPVSLWTSCHGQRIRPPERDDGFCAASMRRASDFMGRGRPWAHIDRGVPPVPRAHTKGCPWAGYGHYRART